MKALAKLKKEPGLSLYEAPIPKVGSNDVKIKIKCTGICGSDARIYKWDKYAQGIVDVPMIIGHEYSGEIVEIGDAVSGFVVGERVTGEGHIACQQCTSCRANQQHLCAINIGVGFNRPGAFAEYLVVPATNVCKLPKNISFEEGAILDPLGSAVHVVLSYNVIGENVLIMGAGAIGIMCALLAQYARARNVVLVDINKDRLELAQKMGVKHTALGDDKSIDEARKTLDIKDGFDICIEVSGSIDAFNVILKQARYGGKVILVGMIAGLMDGIQIIRKGLLIKGIHGREMFSTWQKMFCFLESGFNIKPVITHRFNYSEYEKAFELMLSGKCGKVVLNW